MHKDKIREMTRSILPSTRRKHSRDEKARIHRTHRTQVKQAIRDVGYNIEYDPEDGFWYDDSELMLRINDSEGRRKSDLRYLVSDRRRADKISHFVRWCNARTKHIPEEDVEARYFTISGLIGGPADLIREHALGHFLNPEYDFNPYFGWRSYSRRYPVPIIFTRSVFYTALKDAFASPKHKHLNRVCKSHDWRKCRDDDSCMSSSVKRVWVYHWQKAGRYSWYRKMETSYEPREGEYRPGTLARVLVDKVTHHHDDAQCPNRIILRSMDDVDRLMDHIFGNSEAWTGRRYWGGTLDRLVKELCELFVLHGFMYDYMGQDKS